MTDQQQQRPMSAAQRTLFAALDGVIDEAVGAVVGQMREQHVRWHRDMKNEPSNGCHTCVLIGIAQAPTVEAPMPQPQSMPTPDDTQPMATGATPD